MHKLLIDATGGSYGVRDIELFKSIIERPKTNVFGKEVHMGVFKKAATYLESIALYHVFVDGNKRLSITVASRFLYINDYQITSTNKDIEGFVLKVVINKLEIDIIAKWLKKNSRKIRK